MIISGLLTIILKVLDTLLIFTIPSLPNEIYGYLEKFFGYLESGASILANYTPLPYLLTLFGIILVVDASIMIYHFVIWVLKKVPFVGIE